MRELARIIAIGTRIENQPPLKPWKELGNRGRELFQLLEACNGLYAFEAALHVFPSGGDQMSLEKWNAPQLWRDTYDDLTKDSLFFAEDIFGNQFGICDEQIVSFEAETGAIEPIASSMEEWAARMMVDYPELTGFPLAHAWQELSGPIPEGSRLVPKIPFVLGGAFSIENLHVLDSVGGMRWRGDIAVQIRDLPDGASVDLKIV